MAAVRVALPGLAAGGYTRGMADREHLAKLTEGVEAWNAWRRDYPDIRPDLSAVNFTGANLGGANFSDANLSDGKLRDADLSGADLENADLREADLSGADLNGAALNGAYLYRAALIGAKLIGAALDDANLIDTTLIGANLSGANLTGADIRQANLMNADLSAVKGLDCDGLKRAMHWQLALRHSELDCGEPHRPENGVAPVEDTPVAKAPTKPAVEPAAEPAAEPAEKSHYRIKLGPDDRPAMEIDPERTRRRRPDVSRDQQLAAAADLENSLRELIAAVRKALAGFMETEARPGGGHNRLPPAIADIIDQVVTDAETLILQAKAPAPDLATVRRFKTLTGELDLVLKAALTGDGAGLTATVIGKIDTFLGLFE